MTASVVEVLLTATSYPPVPGGGQALAHAFALELEKSGGFRHRVVTQWTSQRTDWLLGTTVFAPRGTESYDLDGIPVHRLSLTARQRLRMVPHVLTYYARMSGAIDRISDILLEEMAEAGRSVDLVQNVRIGREGLSYASWKLARRLDVPFVFVPLHHPRWVGRRYRDYIELYRQADAVIALTEVERRTLLELGVAPGRVHVVGNGAHLAARGDGARFRARCHLDDAPIVLFLGQKYAYKGMASLLEAAATVWQRCPDARFVFLGPRTPYSRRLFAGVRDPRVLELPACDLQEKTDALAAATVLAVPSAQESFGGVYLEAWAMGAAVVGGPSPAITEVIDEGVDGYIVPQDGAHIAAPIVKLLEDPELRSRMVARGREKLAEKFAWPRLGERMRTIYDALLDHRHASIGT